jgi:hypothetical protein
MAQFDSDGSWIGLKTRLIRYTGITKRIFFRNQIVTNSCMVREIDIQTIKKEDIPFEAPFQLEVRRNDYIQVSIKGQGNEIITQHFLKLFSA